MQDEGRIEEAVERKSVGESKEEEGWRKKGEGIDGRRGERG